MAMAVLVHAEALPRLQPRFRKPLNGSPFMVDIKKITTDADAIVMADA